MDLQSFQVLRLIRLVRLARVFKLITHFRNMALVLQGVAQAVETVFSVILMLVLVVCCVAFFVNIFGKSEERFRYSATRSTQRQSLMQI